MAKTVQEMSAAEYKVWMLQNPDEAKKLDAPTAAPIIPVVVWRNGVAVQVVDNHQASQNGVIQ
jgi:hypothetical protein